MIAVRAPTGKLLFRWDPNEMLLHIITKDVEAWVHLRRDGTYTVTCFRQRRDN